MTSVPVWWKNKYINVTSVNEFCISGKRPVWSVHPTHITLEHKPSGERWYVGSWKNAWDVWSRVCNDLTHSRTIWLKRL